MSRKWAGCACHSSLALAKVGPISVWGSSGVSLTEVTLPLTPRRLSGVHAIWRGIPSKWSSRASTLLFLVTLVIANTLLDHHQRLIHERLHLDPQAAITVLATV
jgi:hypothetical protein